MPRIFRRLTSCIHRSKPPKSFPVNSPKEFFKLSRFELMCDEILIEIFEYLSIKDLYHSFVHLNFRLNLLLRDVRLGIDFNFNDQFDQKSIDYFRKEIVYLHIDSNPMIDLNCFINLRSLSIYLPTRNQLLAINCRIMPKLTRLWIGIIQLNDQRILHENFFGQNSLRKLRFCYLFQMNFNEDFLSFSISSNIRRLVISNIQTKDILSILSYLPCLYQLSIGINDQNQVLTNDLTKNLHRNLRILKIEFLENISQLNHLKILLSFVPYVEQCTLLFVNLIQRKDYLFLQNIILENSIQLKQLICSIDYQCHFSSNQMIRKFQKFIQKFPFFQTMRIIPCIIHQEKCLRKTFMNKTFPLSN